MFAIDSDTIGDNEFRNCFSGTEIVFLFLASVSHGSATGSDVTGGAAGGCNSLMSCVNFLFFLK